MTTAVREGQLWRARDWYRSQYCLLLQRDTGSRFNWNCVWYHFGGRNCAITGLTSPDLLRKHYTLLSDCPDDTG